MDNWKLIYEEFDPAREGVREALCTLGNGYFATRGAAEESAADDVHYPGTYLAGGYNRLDTTMAGRTITNEDLFNCPNWLPITFRVGDQTRWFNLRGVFIETYRQELDLQKGLLSRQVTFADHDGHRFTVASRRLVHMSQPHIAAIEFSLTSENWTGEVTLRAGLDGSIINAGVARYRQLSSTHLELVDCGVSDSEIASLLVRTNQSRIEIAQSARLRVFQNGEAVPCDTQPYESQGFVGHDVTLRMTAGQTVRAEKVVATYTSRDRAIAACGSEARSAVTRVGSFEDLLSEHERAWAALWRRCDVAFEPTNFEQLAIRLNIFHLLQTVSPNTTELDVGVPARGLHGEAYRGHIFWDELFIFPFLTSKHPDITRALLRYRDRRLGAARRLAAERGLRGALFPWQSGSNGREETQQLHLNPRSGRWLPDNSSLQRHVNLAIMYNIWRYYLTTRDRLYLYRHGAEMAIEIGRLLDSLTTLNEETGRYEMLGVMGPDEYHDGYPDRNEPGIDNNAYTNVMTAWALGQVLRTLDILPPELRSEISDRLELADKEVERWADIVERMTVPFHGERIISQFSGYDDLEEFDWEGYREKYGDISRLDRILEAEGDTPNRYKLSKQADVCMLFYLLPESQLLKVFAKLGYPFGSEDIPRNVDYYLARTSHGSTLSALVHAFVLAKVDPERAWPHFCRALTADLRDAHGGTTREGIHLGAMAGAVDILERSYLGLERLHKRLHINPRLPTAIHKLNLRENFRGRWYDIEATPGKLSIHVPDDGQGSSTILVWGEKHEIEAGETAEIDFTRPSPVENSGL